MYIFTLYVCLTTHKLNSGQGISLISSAFILSSPELWVWEFFSLFVCLLGVFLCVVWFFFWLFVCLFFFVHWLVFFVMWIFGLVFVLREGHLKYQRAPQITQPVSLRIKKRFDVQRG